MTTGDSRDFLIKKKYFLMVISVISLKKQEYK